MKVVDIPKNAIAVGRYQSVRRYCKGKPHLIMTALKNYGQKGVHSSNFFKYYYGLEVLDEAGYFFQKDKRKKVRYWYSGWLVLDTRYKTN